MLKVPFVYLLSRLTHQKPVSRECKPPYKASRNW